MIKKFLLLATMFLSTTGLAQAAFPVVESLTETNVSTASTTHSFNLPATVNSGDLLLVIMASSSSTATVTTPTGWTSEGGGTRCAVFSKLADGSEDGSSVSVTLSASATFACQVYRITGWCGHLLNGIESTSFSSSGSATNPNPPSHATIWESSDTLWIACFGSSNNDDVPSAGPSSYSGFDYVVSGGGSGSGCTVGSAYRNLAATSEDPNAFTMTSQTYRALTIAIRPPDTFLIPSEDFDLDETTGTSAVNDKAGGLSGTYARDASNTTTAGPGGTLGTMQDFNGTSDTVTLSGSAVVFSAGFAGSVSVWVKFDSASSYFLGTASTSNGSIRKTSDTRFTIQNNAAGQATFDFAAGIGTSAYRHIVVTRSLSTNIAHVYMDGVDSDNGAVSRSGSLSCPKIGSGSSVFHDGKIGGVRFYAQELDPLEVLDLYNQGVGGGGGGGGGTTGSPFSISRLHGSPFQPVLGPY